MEATPTCPHCEKPVRPEDEPGHGRRCGHCGQTAIPMSAERRTFLEALRDENNG